MEKNNKTNNKAMRLGAAALSVVATTAIVAGGAYAFQGDFTKRGPNSEQREAMEEAVENGDYNAWKELAPGKGKMADMVTEENFKKFSDMHKLAEAGKTDEAKAMAQELGLKGAGGCGMMAGGQACGGLMRGVTPENMEAARTALEKNDYNAWKAAVGDNPISEKITADNFAKLAEAHRLMQEGKYEEAKALREELGLGGPGKMMGGMMKGGMQGMKHGGGGCGQK
ncbi:MAG: hypothetical protein V1867_06710 [Candidatus Falkowbacteria bacterium]